MSNTNNKKLTLAGHPPQKTDFIIDRNSLKNLDPDHEYTLTRTTTEVIKLSKTPSTPHTTSSPPKEEPPTAQPPRARRPPRDTDELFERLVAQFKTRATEYPYHAPSKYSWTDLARHVEWIGDNAGMMLGARRVMQLDTALWEILREAERGRDVDTDFECLRNGAKRRELEDLREDNLADWGRAVKQMREWLETMKKRRDEEERWEAYVETEKEKKKKQKPSGLAGWFGF